jgi:hypothetical protein
MARALIGEDVACGFAAAGFTRTTQRYAYLPPRADRAQIERIGDVLARLSAESSAPLTQLVAWLPRRVPRGTMFVILSGRDPASAAAVTRRIEQSGFPVHFVLFRTPADVLRDARLAGLSVMPGSVVAEDRRPQSVVLGAAPA